MPPHCQITTSALAARIKNVKSKESVEPALYAELGRQKKLVQLDKRHQTLASKLEQWLADKDAYLAGDFSVANSGEARQQLTVFGSFQKEATAMETGPLPDLKKLGAELASEKVRCPIADVLPHVRDRRTAPPSPHVLPSKL